MTGHLGARSEGASIAVSSVVVYELWYGVARSERRRENAERLRGFLSADISVIFFDEEDAKAAGDLRASLESASLLRKTAIEFEDFFRILKFAAPDAAVSLLPRER
jgi:predicted nucleic acid-binding protein